MRAFIHGRTDAVRPARNASIQSARSFSPVHVRLGKGSGARPETPSSIAIAVRGASLAKAQASGVEPEGLAEFLADFGFLCEDAEGHSAESNLHRGAAVVLLDFPRQLVHGSAGLQDLWVRFPWKGRHVDARGVVFGFRAWVGLEAPDDAAWARLVERGEASPPSWASAASGAAPRPGK